MADPAGACGPKDSAGAAPGLLRHGRPAGRLAVNDYDPLSRSVPAALGPRPQPSSFSGRGSRRRSADLTSACESTRSADSATGARPSRPATAGRRGVRRHRRRRDDRMTDVRHRTRLSRRRYDAHGSSGVHRSGAMSPTRRSSWSMRLTIWSTNRTRAGSRIAGRVLRALSGS